ncbi:hypothetical protein [Actinoplanes sp. NPDC026623]|uniref:hypothetical protein n=1 Tax=Actinoplanes sp. NPDC026623 TaxID=3155610 RepID=UPI0033FDFE67
MTDRTLTPAERDILAGARDLVSRAIGAFAFDRVRVYSQSEESPCADGFYNPRSGDVAIHRDALADRHRTLLVLVHEAAHRVGHRGGGRWLPIADYSDRSRGFEHLLSEFAALLLGYLADSAALPEAVPAPAEATPANRRRWLAPADDPAVPTVRRELAHLIADRLPQALADGGFRNEKDLVASTGVHPDYWRTLRKPKVAGHRQRRGGRAWDYDKVGLLAEAAGLHPPVVWLGYHLCEGSMHNRPRERWGQPGRWPKTMRDAMDRACTDLEKLGHPYAEQIPALRALADGKTLAPIGDDTWHAPALRLLAVERARLRLITETP